MKEKLKKIKPSCILEWIFSIIIIYLYAAFNIAPVTHGIATPIVSLLKLFIPHAQNDAGLGAGILLMFLWIVLIIFISVLGIILVKKFKHRLSYPIIFITIFGLITTTLHWKLNSFLNSIKYEKQTKQDKIIGSQIPLTIKQCYIESKKEWPNRSTSKTMIYYIICDAQLNNLSAIEKERKWQSIWLDFTYINKNTGKRSFSDTTELKEYPLISPLNAKIKIYLGNTPTIPSLIISDFTFHSGSHYYDHLNLNLDLDPYLKNL